MNPPLTYPELLALADLRSRDPKVKSASGKIAAAVIRRIHDRKRDADYLSQCRN